MPEDPSPRPASPLPEAGEARRAARLIGLAVERGLLTVADLKRAPALPEPELLDFLCEKGLLSAGARAHLESLASRPGDLSDSGSREARTSSAGPLPGEQFGRYAILRILGEGGMGRVFLAKDPTLERRVALKVLRRDDPALLARFLSEARAQARVEHPNVCRIYETGECEGTAYIAMQYVSGPTLLQLAPKLTVGQKVEILRKAAEAIHAAHREGLVHRDVKPENVLVERRAADLHPYVVDFGLARELEGPSLTASDVIVGTPSYMSPEQARGDREAVGPATDVWGLGATLFEMLTGRPPFLAGSPLDTVAKILRDEAPPLRTVDAAAPRDIEAIVGKCLEKDPGRRYHGADALAADLLRFQQGEPVTARAITPGYRLQRAARKHPVGFAAAGAASLVVVLLLGVTVETRITAARRARAAERFGREAERLVAGLSQDAFLPLHDVRPVRRRARARLDALSVEAEALPRGVRGPGEAAIGRALLALDEPGEARAHLERALALRVPEAEVALPLGRAYATLWRAGLDEAARIPGRELREAHRRKVDQELRDPALRHLRAVPPSADDAPELTEGLVALLERRWDASRQLARRAFERRPDLYAALALEGEAHRREAADGVVHGEFAPAEKHLADAGAAYERAIAIARSAPELYEQDALRWAQLAELQLYRGVPVEASFARVLARVEEAVRADPSRAEPLRIEARATQRLAESVQNKGGDPRALLHRAIEKAEAAIALDPAGAGGAWAVAGGALMRLGEYEASVGRDPRAAYRRGIVTLERGIQRHPAVAALHSNLGSLWQGTADDQLLRGEDPRPAIASAVTAYQRAIDAAPDVGSTRGNLATAWQTLAEWQMKHGLDPVTALSQAVEACRGALARSPDMPFARTNLGNAHLTWGIEERFAGRDPSARYEDALLAYREERRKKPDNWGALAGEAQTQLEKATDALEKGRDPSPHLAAAEALLPELERASAGSFTASVMSGGAALLRARLALARGTDSAAPLASARRAYREALRRNADFHDAEGGLAEVAALAARAALQARRAPHAPLAEGRPFLAAALARQPEDPSLRALVAAYDALEAQARARTDPEAARALAAKAREALEGAVAARPSLAADWREEAAAAVRLAGPR